MDARQDQMGDKGENSTKGIGLKQTTRRNLL